jgi:hypothetical protein
MSATEPNKVLDDLDDAIGELLNMDTAQQKLRDARPYQQPRAEAPYRTVSDRPTPVRQTVMGVSPTGQLEAATNEARDTVKAVNDYATFLTGLVPPPRPERGKPPEGMLPTVAYHAGEIASCLQEIRRTLEQLRRSA